LHFTVTKNCLVANEAFVISRDGLVVLKAIVKSAILIATVAFFLVSDLALSQAAYPFGLANSSDTPGKRLGGLFITNCHLAAKPAEVEVPQSWFCRYRV